MKTSKLTILIFFSILAGGCAPKFALNRAIFFHDLATAKAILDEGHDVNTPQNWRSHLMLAAMYSNPEMIRLMLDYGANVNDKDDQGVTALMLAASPKTKDQKSVAFENMALLIERGADVNAKDINGTTPLMLAVGYNDAKCVKLLIDHGADINAKNNLGLTAAMFALFRWHSFQYAPSRDSLEIINLLEDSSAVLNSNAAFLILPWPEIELYQVVGDKDKPYENIETIRFARRTNLVFGRVAVFQPGEYQLKAAYSKTTQTAPAVWEKEYGKKIPISLQTKGGGLYALKYQFQGSNWVCWIEEFQGGAESLLPIYQRLLRTNSNSGTSTPNLIKIP